MKSPPRLDRLMRAALFQAGRNLGRTWPNPSVGAIIADRVTGEIFASAVTAVGGRPHAEVLALQAAGERARGALLVVTLEPCSHHGVTPPCADAIVDAGVAAVAYGSGDPDARVAGRGLSRLREAGIEVCAAPLRRESDWLNLGHILRVTEGRPFVQLKAAVDADGFVAAGTGSPIWVTGQEARDFGHLLRAKTDAILVGANTVRADNPSLTCRLPGMEAHSPIRAVFWGGGELPERLSMLQDGGPQVWTLRSGKPPSLEGKAEPPGRLGGGMTRLAKVFPFISGSWQQGTSASSGKGITPPEGDALQGGQVNIKEALTRLADEGITRVLVEGGPALWRAFLEARFCDEIVIVRAAGRISKSRALRGGLENIAEDPNFVTVEEFHAGADTVTVFRARAYWKA